MVQNAGPQALMRVYFSAHSGTSRIRALPLSFLRIKSKINTNPKGGGQECPPYTIIFNSHPLLLQSLPAIHRAFLPEHCLAGARQIA